MWPGIGLCEKIHGMSRRAPIIFALLAVILTVSLACERKAGSGGRDASTESTTVLRRGNGGDPQTLDPARAEDVHSFNVLTDLYEGLVEADGRGNTIPGVAERWDISSDGLSYTFYLREAARWSNGQPVSAEHFVAGFERALSPTTASAYGFLLYPVRNAEEVALGQQPVSALGISAPDTGTLTIELQAPAPHLLSVLAGRRDRVAGGARLPRIRPAPANAELGRPVVAGARVPVRLVACVVSLGHPVHRDPPRRVHRRGRPRRIRPPPRRPDGVKDARESREWARMGREK